MRHFFLLLLLTTATFYAYAQEEAQESVQDSIIKVQAGFQSIDEEKYPDAIVYTRNTAEQVFVQHKGIDLWCDRAFFYKTDNFVKAFGNVRMQQGDSVSMTSKYAEYNGNSQLAFAAGKVFMRNPDSRLYTDTLYFDRVKQQAYYRSGGTVRDTASTLRSKVGRYYLEQKKYQFLKEVKITNPKYVINSDHIEFFSETGYVKMYGPSTIDSKTSKVYCERGFYDTRADNGYFVKNSRIDYDNRFVTGDSIFFDRPSGFASATNNVKVTDPENESIAQGHYAEVYRDKDSVIMTKRAYVVTKQEKDSVYVRADTILITGPEDHRKVRGFRDVRLLRADMSGRGDSLHTDQKSGVTQLIRNPVLFSGKSQMTGDSIHLLRNTVTDQIDSLKVFYNAFLIDRDTSGGFNQVKGRQLYGLFNENELYKVDIIKNVENLFYARNDQDELIGINKGTAGRLEMLLEDDEITDLRFFTQSEDDLYPLSKLPVNARKLRGFKWRGDERIKNKRELFAQEAPFKLVKIQGLPLPDIDEDFFNPELEEKDIPKSSILKIKDLKTRPENTIQLNQPMIGPIIKTKK